MPSLWCYLGQHMESIRHCYLKFSILLHIIDVPWPKGILGEKLRQYTGRLIWKVYPKGGSGGFIASIPCSGIYYPRIVVE